MLYNGEYGKMMSTNSALLSPSCERPAETGSALARSITHAASAQTCYTILVLADRDRVQDAYRAYAYFRWLDDTLDGGALSEPARRAIVARQQALVERCYRGVRPSGLSDEERLLSDLIARDGGRSSGLETYIRHMMAVMAFDATRRGKLVSGQSLTQYTRWLSTAVTEAMHHFIGYGSAAPRGEARYAAVTAAHITHMLRDTLDDASAGYFNVPRELVEGRGIDPADVSGDAYRAWVRERVHLARGLFNQGRAYLARVESARCRLAAHAYIARFEFILDAIERDGFVLRPAYPERKSLPAALWMAHQSLAGAFAPRRPARGQVLSFR